MSLLASSLVTAIEHLEQLDVAYALVGGLAVSCHVEPRFTRDVDLAIAISDDAEGEAVVRAMRARGWTPVVLVGDAAFNVHCDMTTDGGGWTIVAPVTDQTYTTPPPNIGVGTEGTFADWAAHAWTSDGDFYEPLALFGSLTDGTTEVLRINRNSSGVVLRKLLYSSFDYDHVANTISSASCTNLVGSACTSIYSWDNQPPNFDGWGETGGCHADYTSYWNYHNFSGCASDSGLFGYDNGTIARPGLIGTYQGFAHQQQMLVR